MKRLILIFVAVMGLSLEAGAVLKEKDLEQTLAILQVELEQYNNELTVRSVRRQERRPTRTLSCFIHKSGVTFLT